MKEIFETILNNPEPAMLFGISGGALAAILMSIVMAFGKGQRRRVVMVVLVAATIIFTATALTGVSVMLFEHPYLPELR